MTGPRKVLSAIIAVIAAAMAVAAVYCVLHPNLTRDQLATVSGAEVVAMALFVLPWFTVYAHKAAVRFSPGEMASGSWRMLAGFSVLLSLGQLIGYLPSVLHLGSIEPIMVILGQVMPASFRVVLCLALYRMRRAYRDSGLDFQMRTSDYVLSIAVALMALVLIVLRESLFNYWSANAEFDAMTRQAMLYAQIFNFLLYPAVFFLSLTIFRYAAQMGGGLVARAWGGVALYGVLQPVHAFVIALGFDSFGPILSIAFDNFIVLFAFSALTFGPIFQVEASDMKTTE